MTNVLIDPIRVLVIDDDRVARAVVTSSLARSRRVTVVGEAASGIEGLRLAETLRPDAVVLDVVMPVMDGIEVLAVLKRRYPGIRVVVFSQLGTRGNEAATDALMLGADDCIAKPRSLPDQSEAQLERMFVASLVRLFPPPERVPAPAPSARVQTATPGEPVALRGSPARTKPSVIGVAVSTGGPNALSTVLPALPRSLDVPVVVVQHIPAEFAVRLVESLDLRCGLPVRIAGEGNEVGPGIWFAPGGRHLEVVRSTQGVKRFHLHDGPKVQSCRPAADVLFRSLVQVFGSSVLGVVLTGMGHDGTAGSQAVVDAGGSVIAQDQASSVVWGMPGSVARAGIASEILPLEKLAEAVVRRVVGKRDSKR